MNEYEARDLLDMLVARVPVELKEAFRLASDSTSDSTAHAHIKVSIFEAAEGVVECRR